MAEEKDKGKNIFEQAKDALSTRDEKAAVDAAKKQVQELEQKLQATEKKLAETEAELAKAEKDMTTMRTSLTSVQSRAWDAERKLGSVNAELQKYVSADQAKQIADAAEAAARSNLIAEHKLTAEETLSHLALKYYGSAYEPYWRVIYEANKELIGDNPARVRPGMLIKIPVLPDELKK